MLVFLMLRGIEKLLEFKQSGKFIYSYSEVYTQLSYYLSSVSDSIFLHPQGMVEFNGLVFLVYYFIKTF